MKPVHPFGTKKPSLEQNFYDIFNQANVELVDLRESPIEKITPSGLKTSSTAHEFDILVLATGFDTSTGCFTQIELQGSGGKRRELLYHPAPQHYLEQCQASAAGGYTGFDLS